MARAIATHITRPSQDADMVTMQSQIIPNRRADGRRPRPNLAAVATGVTLLALGVLALVGTPFGLLALVALVGLGGIMIFTGERIEKRPPTVLTS